MNYKKQYENLITRAQNRTLNSYSEKHHILPRCLGGTDKRSNLVRLTGREHFVAHVLLVKMYPEERGLIYAVNMMCRFNKKQERSKNRMYGWLRERFASESKRRTHTEEAKAKISAGQKGRKHTKEHIAKLTGQKRSAETKRKMSLAATGKPKSEAHKKSLSKATKGRKLTEEQKNKLKGWNHSTETKKKMSVSAKGKPKSEAHIENMRLAWVKRKENRG